MDYYHEVLNLILWLLLNEFIIRSIDQTTVYHLLNWLFKQLLTWSNWIDLMFHVERLIADAASGEFERRPVHVRMPAVLHQGRDHARRLNRGQHPAGHPTLWAVHPQRALHLREPWRYRAAGTGAPSSVLRQRTRHRRAHPATHRQPRHSRQTPRLPLQPPRATARAQARVVPPLAGLQWHARMPVSSV